MHFDNTQMQAFYEEVHVFCDKYLPDDLRRRVALGHMLHKNDYGRWQRILRDKGWLGGFWPKEYGGQGWSAFKRFVFDQAVAAAGAPPPVLFGLSLAAPVIYTFGSDEQKARHLPGILESTTWWCQGYSEPGAGSDLVAVKTAAVRDGDDYVVNGQKIWTTNAHWADWMFCLVRTSSDGPNYQGISFLLIDMTSPGISVRPIRTIDGEHHLNEVFFDNVRVPVANRVGEEGAAWSYAKHLLSHERFTLTNAGRTHRTMGRLKRLAANTFERGRPLTADRGYVRKIAEAEIRERALLAFCEGVLERVDAGEHVGDEVAIFKLRGSELYQFVNELEMDVAGRHGLRQDVADLASLDDAPATALKGLSGAAREYFFNRSFSIAGGSSEVQRNIIAKSVFGF